MEIFADGEIIELVILTAICGWTFIKILFAVAKHDVEHYGGF